MTYHYQIVKEMIDAAGRIEGAALAYINERAKETPGLRIVGWMGTGDYREYLIEIPDDE